MQARKNKTAKNPELTVKATVEGDNSGINDQDMDEREDWARSPTGEPYSDLSPESRDLTQDF